MTEHADRPAKLPAPPPLPQRLVDIRPLLGIGTGAWFIAFVVLLLGDRGEWMWTSLAGWLLGIAGFAVAWWQRTAADSGRRGAQRGLAQD
ncbi:MAG: DUF2530 domain-containing protein [Sciscionella sp.]|nr:DUF2530 domain-containing protein [Sciscionella sp.]